MLAAVMVAYKNRTKLEKDFGILLSKHPTHIKFWNVCALSSPSQVKGTSR